MRSVRKAQSDNLWRLLVAARRIRIGFAPDLCGICEGFAPKVGFAVMATWSQWWTRVARGIVGQCAKYFFHQREVHQDFFRAASSETFICSFENHNLLSFSIHVNEYALMDLFIMTVRSFYAFIKN